MATKLGLVEVATIPHAILLYNFVWFVLLSYETFNQNSNFYAAKSVTNKVEDTLLVMCGAQNVTRQKE